jgi:hypothetical protein
MPLSNAAQSSLLQLLLENTGWSNLGDATGLRGSTVAGSVYVALHTADPGASGNQSTNEANYTGYARVAIARGPASFVRSGTSPTISSNAAAVTFPVSSGGPTNIITHFSIGVASAGATAIIVSAPVSSPATVALGVTPSFSIGVLAVTAT